MPISNARDLGIGDEFYRISAASILRDRDIIKVSHPVVGVHNNVLKDRPEANSVEDFGLLLRGEVDTFGVTTTLYVEDTSIGPDVLIIADQQAVRISGQGPVRDVMIL